MENSSSQRATNRDFPSYIYCMLLNKGLMGAIPPKSHRLAMLRVYDAHIAKHIAVI